MAVRRHRVKSRFFRYEIISRGAISAARRREQKTRDACGFRQLRQPHRSVIIDVISQIGVQVAERIVGQAGEMQHGVEAFQLIRLDIPNILSDCGHFDDTVTVRAPLIKIAVEPHDFVTMLQQHRRQYGSDVSQMARDQCFHAFHSQVFHGGSPFCHICSRMTFSRNVSIHCQKDVCLYAMSCPSRASRCSGSCSHMVWSPSI